jgi:hypothetical protein
LSGTILDNTAHNIAVKNVGTLGRNAMKRIIGLLLIGTVVVGIAPLARSLDAQSMPPNVSSSDWVPISDAAGFVITHDTFGSAQPTQGSVKGYFVIHRSGAWLRVDAEPNMRTTPAGAGHGRVCPSESIANFHQI